LLPAAARSAGERSTTPRDFAHHVRPPLPPPRGRLLIPGQDQEVATAMAFSTPNASCTGTRVHNRDPPVAVTVRNCSTGSGRRNGAAARRRQPFRPLGQAVVAGRGRTGEDRLPTLSSSRVASPAASKPKSNTLAPGRPSGVSCGEQIALDARLDLAPESPTWRTRSSTARAVRAQAGECAVNQIRARRAYRSLGERVDVLTRVAP